MSTQTIIQTFLQHIFSGATDQALALVDPEARFISTRPVPNPNNPLHGTFVGIEGARRFFSGFGELLEPGEFNIEASFAEGEHAAMYGTLRHRSRTTGKPFPSDWALICRVKDGRIVLYHFYEDTEALRDALS
ncbi:nuclear transport factor 2 family protein [Microvirga sp. VF16]|uniref:nuclear transport factor 2 family protein n=1 Tax=Microvirga sp. VF16 TaxID=2807101 RepID=UPI00193DCF7A|nr:nuclear transport factor 2 family protein [Microvirga sp. VF16]QRM33133.1 nuclear transport factor 2 family protein [Microvirga sp. VF16]